MNQNNAPVKGKIEYKSFGGNVKDVSSSTKTITGYYAAFDNVDSGLDVLRKGSFAKTVQERGPLAKNDVFHLKQHNWLHVMGKPTVLKEDGYGLYFETKFADTVEANDVLKLYDAGIYKEHSIGFSYVNYEPVKKDGELQYWDVTEVKLYEGSTVAIAMNRNAIFTGMKSDPVNFLKELYQDLDVCVGILKLGNLSDDTYKCAERRYNQIKEEFTSIDTLFANRPPQAPAPEQLPSQEMKSFLEMIDKVKQQFK